MTKTSDTHPPLAGCTGDRALEREDHSIQQALAVLLDAGITFEVIDAPFDRAA